MPTLARAFWVALKLITIIAIIWLGSCAPARMLLEQAPREVPDGFTPSPFASIPEDRALSLFEDIVYGPVQPSETVNILSHEVIRTDELDGTATLRQWRVELGFPAATREFDLVLLSPNKTPDAPVIIMQKFCPNQVVMPFAGVRSVDTNTFCKGRGVMGALTNFFFGRYNAAPPHEAILESGFAIAALYPSQIIPDSGSQGLATLEQLYPEAPDRPGALAVWAGAFETVASVIENEIGARPIIAFGHSRFAKTALMAAAWSDDIDAVIAHQSGTLGASSLTDSKGEPLNALIDSYPHWASPDLVAYKETANAIPVRPADLLSAIRPKPVLLGNARRDVWSDPFGAFKEAKLAFGSQMTATDPEDFVSQDRYAYWLRPGTHGVVKEDWDAFLDFLTAQNFDDAKWRPREDLNPQPAD